MAKKTDSLRVNLITLTEQIESLSDKILGPFKRPLAEAKQQFEKLEKEINKEKGVIASSERQLAKSRARLADLEHDVTECDSELVSASERLDAVTQELSV